MTAALALAAAFAFADDAAAQTGNGDGLSSSVPTAEGYPAILAYLSSLSSLRERASHRNWVEGATEEGGVWARVSDASAILEPSTALSADPAYDIEETRYLFGADIPVREDFNIGGGFWFHQSTSSVTSTTAKGNIDGDGFGFLASATMLRGPFHADGQLQYAGLSSDLEAAGERIATGNDASALSAAAEVGYRALAGDVALIPQLQVIWSDVDFENFVDPAGASIDLEDGDIVRARLGLGLDWGWDNRSGEGIFRANADVHSPLDGETSVTIGGRSAATETEKIFFDMGAGFFWQWDSQYALTVDASTAQGDEMEEYRGAFSLRFGF